MSGKETIFEVCKNNYLELSNSQLELLSAYVDRLMEWNEKINLVSRKSGEEVWIEHIVGSLSLLFGDALAPRSRVLDLGSGGGLPGIPIAVAQPDLQVVLVDSIRKKINAVEEILGRLQLKNVEVVCARAEELKERTEFRQRFDYVVARAVAQVRDILKWSKPLLNNGAEEEQKGESAGGKIRVPRGSVIMLKGGDLTREIGMARGRYPGLRISCTPVVVRGLGPEQLADKKIVVAQL
jgi:16S rRNA (guanine527-N7)-methyltransferase